MQFFIKYLSSLQAKVKCKYDWNLICFIHNGSNSLNSDSELGTLEWDTFNPDCLIRISNVDTFNFLLNPLFFGYKAETGFSKLQSPSRFCIVILNGAQNLKFPGFCYATLIG